MEPATSAYLNRPCRSLAEVLLVRAERSFIEIDAGLAVAAAHSSVLDAAAMLRQVGVVGRG